MDWFLPRGYSFSPNNRIKRLIAEGPAWQIFVTGLDTFALVVKRELYEQWVVRCALPEAIFATDQVEGYAVLVSSGNYMIASLAQGPFPENNGQIEAFSHAFKKALSADPNLNLHDGIYIEEYSLILPVSFDGAYEDHGVAYGRWLTGGINISIKSIDRVSKIMSWLPAETLVNAAKIAGFDDMQDSDSSAHQAVELPEAAALSEGTVTVRSKDKFTLIGRPELELFFNENIIDIVLNQEQYRRMGIPFPGATILYGPTGCGKTYAVERLAEYLGWRRFDIDSSTIASSYIHDTSKKIAEIFQRAIKAAPSMIVIDEMEAFLADRGMAGPSGMHHLEEVAEFLRRIPEAAANGVLVFAMTNMIESIDPAILRRGRFDHIVEVKPANEEEVEALLRNKFLELPVEEAVNPAMIAKELANRPMSDITFVLREAGRFAVKKSLEKMNADCFSEALALLPKKKERAKVGFIT